MIKKSVALRSVILDLDFICRYIDKKKHSSLHFKMKSELIFVNIVRLRKLKLVATRDSEEYIATAEQEDKIQSNHVLIRYTSRLDRILRDFLLIEQASVGS